MSLPHAAPSPAAPVSSISRIGRFYIARELGRGASGCVYLAQDPVIDRTVAIKSFNPRLPPAEKSKHQQQFINEARAAGRLSHPNIVTIYDAVNEGGSTYIVMEYLRGRELDQLLDNGHRFRPDQVAPIIWKIADALDHAHKHGVIHRDIKPSNIFMAAGDQPKLVDFGIARSPNRISDKRENPDQPYTLFCNNLLGTPNYMSPEQASGKPVDVHTDIYSLGAVMYEMLTGRKPFQTNDTEKLLHQIVHRTPQAPHEIDDRVPIVLSHIAMKAMSKRPEKRYQTAEQMALDIRRYMVREKRARRGMKLPMGTLEQKEPNVLPERRALFRMGFIALALAGSVAVIGLLR